MKLKFTLVLFLLTYCIARAQPSNDDCETAIVISNVVNYCSANAEFNNIGATNQDNLEAAAGWSSAGKDVWFKFTAIRYDINITVTGAQGNSGTINTPNVALYTSEDCRNYEQQIGSVLYAEHVTTLYKGGLTIGKEYYIRISGETNETGSFKLCLNNYNPVLKSGQDCSSASYLCSKESFTQTDITGAGQNNRESEGTCLDPRNGPGSIEANTAWYKWTAANNGTLTFAITPTNNDDIDWVLYDLGTADECNSIIAANAIRCASGSGLTCTPYYKATGLNLESVETTESSGCFPGQDGFVKYIDMQQGHVYALLINNFSNRNNGFTMDFGGTGEFLGPKSDFEFSQTDPCTTSQSFTFNNKSSNYSNLKWSFGTGASILSTTAAGPHIIKYNTSGIKTVTLKAIGANGCSVIQHKTFTVGIKPEDPVISINQSKFCVGDTLKMSIMDYPGASFAWTGPNGFISDKASFSIPVTDFNQAGIYSLSITVNGCGSAPVWITIPPINPVPVANFSSEPGFSTKLSMPVSIQFYNESANADAYLWNFGDGTTSSEFNPVHVYHSAGDFEISLTAYKSDLCSASVTKGKLVVKSESTLFIPNTFTPNGDGINDEFAVNLTNLKNYKILIYNRFGTWLFQTTDIFDDWKGTYNDQPVPVGTYYYVIDAIDAKGAAFKKGGSITVLR